MDKRPLGKTGLRIAPLVFGGNVFGWTIDEKQSFAVLDAFVDMGFDAIDSADAYSRWVHGHKGGESETIIGKWLKTKPGLKDKVVVFTKVGSDMGDGHKGLKEKWILQAAEDSLRRLGVDAIDLYFSHWPDPSATHEETLGAYAKLLQAGKVKSIGASNYDAALLGDALKTARDQGLPSYAALQPHYNLIERAAFEGPLRDLCISEGLGVVPYFSLASGFLTGKYRSKADLGQSPRGQGVGKYLTARGQAVLAALDEVSGGHGVKPAEVALAWLMAQPGVTAPIASATKVAQVESFAKAAALELSGEDTALLDKASA
jgi:aryl-alcohol dehydrogenase-like predicted oxidoreductase